MIFDWGGVGAQGKLLGASNQLSGYFAVVWVYKQMGLSPYVEPELESVCP